MKCPSCQFVSSDLRDICPRCLHDLRTEKKLVGLEISYPEATYQELLQKLTGSPPSPTPSKDESKTTKSFFSRLFKKSSKPISETVTEVESIVERPSNLDPTPTEHEALENKMKELFDIEEELNITNELKSSFDHQDKILEALNNDQLKVEEVEVEVEEITNIEELKVEPIEAPSIDEREYMAPLDEMDISQEEKIEFNSTDKEETEIIELPEVVSDIDDLVAQALDQVEESAEYPQYEQRSEYIDSNGGVNIESNYDEELSTLQAYSSMNDLNNYEIESENIFVENEATEVLESEVEEQFEEISYEDLSNLDGPNNDMEIIEQSTNPLSDSKEYEVDNIEIEALFNEASNEISSLIEGVDFDIALAPSIVVNKDEVEVLFSLSQKELEAPSSISELIEDIDLSSSREIESVDVANVLKQTEEAIETPKLSLKELVKDEANRLKRKLADGFDVYNSIYGKKSKGPAPAPIWKRIAASAIDTSLVIIITFAIVGFLCLTLTPELSDKLWNLASYEFYTALPLYGLILATYIITYFLHPILSLYFMHNTFGMYLTGIRLRTNDLKRLRLSHLFVRSFSRPISILLGGFLLPLFGKKSLPDYLAQTVIIS